MDPEIARAHNQMMRDTRTVRLTPALVIFVTCIGVALAVSFDVIWVDVVVGVALAWAIWFGVKAAFLGGMIAAYRDASKRFEELRDEAAQEQIDWDNANPLRVVGPS